VDGLKCVFVRSSNGVEGPIVVCEIASDGDTHFRNPEPVEEALERRVGGVRDAIHERIRRLLSKTLEVEELFGLEIE